MNINEHIDYWKKSALHDFETAESLYNSKKYDWCLYLGHLVLEKTLKALYVKSKGQHPPKTHMLHILAIEAEIEIDNDTLDLLKKINEFNIETRYPDYKFNFYKLCTKEFSELYFNKIEDLYKWLLMKI